MKTKISSLLMSVMLAASALLAVQARAEAEAGGPPAGGPGGPGGGERRERPAPGERLERMREHLGLTDAQVEQLKKIFAAEAKEMQALRKDEDTAQKDKREKMQAIRQKYQAQVAAVLTEEQRAKVEEAKKKRMENGGGDRPAERREGRPEGKGKGKGDGKGGDMPPPPAE